MWLSPSSRLTGKPSSPGFRWNAAALRLEGQGKCYTSPGLLVGTRIQRCGGLGLDMLLHPGRAGLDREPFAMSFMRLKSRPQLEWPPPLTWEGGLQALSLPQAEFSGGWRRQYHKCHHSIFLLLLQGGGVLRTYIGDNPHLRIGLVCHRLVVGACCCDRSPPVMIVQSLRMEWKVRGGLSHFSRLNICLPILCLSKGLLPWDEDDGFREFGRVLGVTEPPANIQHDIYVIPAGYVGETRLSDTHMIRR